jgi:hypothetical protein
MSEPTSASRPGPSFRMMTVDTAVAIDDAIAAVARLSPVRVTRLSIDQRNSTNDIIRVMAELRPAPPQETGWWWREQIDRRVPVHGVSMGAASFSVGLDVPLDRLEATAVAVRAAVVEADAAFASSYAADVRARHQLGRDMQERERLRFADAQAVLDRVMSR